MKPQTFSADLSNLPPALVPYTLESRWVVWRWVERTNKDGSTEWTKPPYMPDHYRSPAKSNKSDTWGTYEKALTVVQAGKADGIGLMLFGIELAASDLDKCLAAGKLDPWAQDIVDKAIAAGCYIEATVSGTGVRVLCLSAGPELGRRWATNGHGAGIELYRNTARYITISGCEIGRCDRLPQTDFFDNLYQRYVDHPPKPNGEAKAKNNGSADPFDFSQASEQDADIDDIIANGVPEGSRSEAFQRVVFQLAEQGLGADEIEERLRQHPTGIAAKYIKRLRKEIDRSFEKWRSYNRIVVPEAVSTGAGAAGSQPSSGPGGFGTPFLSTLSHSRGGVAPTPASQFRSLAFIVASMHFTVPCCSKAQG